jgi:transmembrane sensor
MKPDDSFSARDKRSMNILEDEAICWLTTLNSPEVSKAKEEAFFAWLSTSPAHQAAYLKAEQLWQRGAALAHVSSPAARASQPVVWFLAAAASLLLVGLVFLFPMFKSPDELIFQTAIGEQKKVLLEDGSQLELNTNSTIKMIYSRTARVAHLEQGEVFFSVKKDQSRPFDVVTDAGQVRVVGTRFAVQRLKEDVVVTVEQGAVALGSVASNNEEFKSSRVLGANQRLALSAAIKGQEPEQIDTRSGLAWRDRLLVYRGQSMAQVVEDFQRYFPISIELADERTAQISVTAVIQLKDANTAISSLSDAFNLQVKFDQTGSRVILQSR